MRRHPRCFISPAELRKLTYKAHQQSSENSLTKLTSRAQIISYAAVAVIYHSKHTASTCSKLGELKWGELQLFECRIYQTQTVMHSTGQYSHGGQIDSLWGKRRGLELGAELSNTETVTVSLTFLSLRILYYAGVVSQLLQGRGMGRGKGWDRTILSAHFSFPFFFFFFF